MIKLWKNIKCLFGFHDWEAGETTFGIRFRCRNCGKVER